MGRHPGCANLDVLPEQRLDPAGSSVAKRASRIGLSAYTGEPLSRSKELLRRATWWALPRPLDWGWGVFLLAVIVAVIRVVTTAHGRESWRADETVREAIFQSVAAQERSTRAAAARGFPGDPWSADDDFHNHEQRQVRDAARAKRVSLSDGFRAVDEGLRNHRQPSSSEGPTATVPPCRPRPSY